MSAGPKYVLSAVILVVVVIVGYRYQQYVVAEQYLLVVNTVCDPAIEKCFVSDCSPVDDAACDNAPYKKITLLAKYAPSCLEEHTCDHFSCSEIAGTCRTTYCSTDTLEDGVVCMPDTNH